MKPQLFIGLISGTSVDGIDVAITDFSSERPQLVAFDCHPINPDLASDIHALCADETLLPADVKNPNHSIARVDLALGEVYAQAITETLAKAALSAADIVAIGNHGQTVRHQPPQRSAAEQPVRHGFSIQIGSNQGSIDGSGANRSARTLIAAVLHSLGDPGCRQHEKHSEDQELTSPPVPAIVCCPGRLASFSMCFSSVLLIVLYS